MILCIRSGGQTGADRAGLVAAKATGIPHGGWAPRLWLVEAPDGRSHVSDPTLGTEFGLLEYDEPAGDPPPRADRRAWAAWAAEAYKARTAANVRDSDGTVWFGSNDSRGFGATAGACRRLGKPLFVVKAGETRPGDVIRWIEEKGIRELNVAGNRASTAPGLADRVEAFLGIVFRLLAAHAPAPQPVGPPP